MSNKFLSYLLRKRLMTKWNILYTVEKNLDFLGFFFNLKIIVNKEEHLLELYEEIRYFFSFNLRAYVK